MKRLNDQYKALFPKQSPIAFADGSPLPIGGASSDPDGKAGRGVKGFARGYKIHLICGEKGEIHNFRIRSMNVYEGHPLIEMSGELPGTIKKVFADGNYDSTAIHRALAQQGITLIAPVKTNRVGRRGCIYRKRALRYLQTPRGKSQFKKRNIIERVFGNLKSLSFGLQGLPNWVRRFHRVQPWITSKLIFFLANKIRKHH